MLVLKKNDRLIYPIWFTIALRGAFWNSGLMRAVAILLFSIVLPFHVFARLVKTDQYLV